jgi:DNA-binding CsgD family transcriptional regulator
MSKSEFDLQKPRPTGEETWHTASPPTHGFLVVDSSLQLVFASRNAAAILAFPKVTSQNLSQLFQKKIRAALVDGGVPPNCNGQSVMKLKSGRRTYICRAFLLNSNGKGMNETATLLILERGMPGRLALRQIGQQFHLTNREQQAVALLLQGLTNKEVADIMGVSVNTVRAFLRLATVRMGVSSRSGIVTKILHVILLGSIPSGSAEPSPVA